MDGIESVAEAMMWLAKPGSRCLPMMRPGLAPMSCAAVQKSSSRSASSLERTARASPGPVEQAQNDGDAEKDQHRRPGDRERGRERHPERQFREGAHDLDDPLREAVHPAAVIAGEPAYDDAERKGNEDADEAHGERDARAVHDAREHVPPEPVGAEQEQRRAAPIRGADEMQVGLEQAPEAVVVAAAEEAQRIDLFRVLDIDALQLREVERAGIAIDDRPDEPRPGRMVEVDRLGRYYAWIWRMLRLCRL